MAKTFDYFFDFGSLASYLAHTQLDKIQAETGASPIYLPMLLGAVFKATGNVSPVSVPAKGKYLFVDFKRFADSYGVSLNNNPFFFHHHHNPHAHAHWLTDAFGYKNA